MKIDSVRFATPVRVHGDTFLTGISPDSGGKQWDMRVDQDSRVVLLKGLGTRFKDQLWVVPFENVACMRVIEEPAIEVVRKK